MRTTARIGILGLTLALSLPIGTAGAAGSAGSSGPRPRIIEATWITAPVNAGSLEMLEIRAVDPDGIVSQLNVLWGDGSFTHADLICLGPGEVATVRLTHRYSDPGRVVVRIQAFSSSRCFGPAEQKSPQAKVATFVRPN